MEKIDLNTQKQLMTDMLQNFHDICVQHNLRYSLAYGTLLGAIRHQGYIPWDDDVDVMMPRVDYDKLMQISASEFNCDYELKEHNRSNCYIHPMAKLVNVKTLLVEHINKDSVPELGVYIDIFPVDKIPLNEKKRNSLYKKCRLNYFKLCYSVIKYQPSPSFLKNIIKKILLSYYTMRSSKPFMKKYDEYVRYSKSLDSDYGKVIVICEECHDEMKMEAFNNLILTPFENKQFYIIKNYDQLLTNEYGDYMQLPKEEDRVTHDSLAYWK